MGARESNVSNVSNKMYQTSKISIGFDVDEAKWEKLKQKNTARNSCKKWAQVPIDCLDHEVEKVALRVFRFNRLYTCRFRTLSVYLKNTDHLPRERLFS